MSRRGESTDDNALQHGVNIHHCEHPPFEHFDNTWQQCSFSSRIEANTKI
jgi:hypothetical protein